MRALKILVILMGVLIVGGVGLLGALIAGRMGRGPTARVTAGPPYAAAPIDLPAGARIAAMSTGSDRVVLDLALADGSRELLVIDLSSGRRLGTIPLRSGR